MIRIIAIILALVFSGCSVETSARSQAAALNVTGSLELEFAEQFSVDYLSDGSALIKIGEDQRFVAVPEGQPPPEGLPEDAAVITVPVSGVYLAATSAMCLFDALDKLDAITMTGTKAENWYIENAKAAVESGEIIYAGRYNAPDYELLLANDCKLALQSTMITHAPEVEEKLEELGIPVMMERSSYESHPLGRTEWIKLYGLLTGKPERAREIFQEQSAYLSDIPAVSTGKTAAFFYISSAGGAVVRRGGDYVAKMIELAGGEYVFEGLGEGESAAGSVNMEMELFYTGAKNADYIIYNSSIDGEITSIDELLGKNSLLADFKAVRNGGVWCTGKDLFQDTTGFGALISDMHRIFTGETENMRYLYRLT